MGETEDTGEEKVLTENDEGGVDQGDQTDTGADNEAEGADKSDDDNAQKGDEADKGKTESKPTPPADEEPKTRKRNIDFILERKNRKIEKLQDKNNEQQGEDEDDLDNLDPSDAKIIEKQVAKVLSPFLAKQMLDEDSQEIGTFVKDNPDFAPYAARVAKFAQHQSRKDMPIESIFYEVAGKDLLKLGADRAKKAVDEAKESRAGGSTGPGGSSEKSVWDLTPDEFSKQQESLRNKPRE